MAKYIDRESLIEEIEADFNADWHGYSKAFCHKEYVDGARDEYKDVLKIIYGIETIDVHPVKQRVKLHDKHPDTEGYYLVCDQYGEYEVSVVDTENKTTVSDEFICMNEDKYAELKARAYAELQAFQKKYAMISELDTLMTMIDTIINE